MLSQPKLYQYFNTWPTYILSGFAMLFLPTSRCTLTSNLFAILVRLSPGLTIYALSKPLDVLSPPARGMLTTCPGYILFGSCIEFARSISFKSVPLFWAMSYRVSPRCTIYLLCAPNSLRGASVYILSTWPGYILSGSFIELYFTSSSTVTPNLRAIAYSVSPL